VPECRNPTLKINYLGEMISRIQAVDPGSVRALIAQIADYINSWNANPRLFTWIATADEILAKVKVVEANVRKLVDNNAQ